jgi:hypothetical protein
MNKDMNEEIDWTDRIYRLIIGLAYIAFLLIVSD